MLIIFFFIIHFIIIIVIIYYYSICYLNSSNDNYIVITLLKSSPSLSFPLSSTFHCSKMLPLFIIIIIVVGKSQFLILLCSLIIVDRFSFPFLSLFLVSFFTFFPFPFLWDFPSIILSDILYLIMFFHYSLKKKKELEKQLPSQFAKESQIGYIVV